MTRKSKSSTYRFLFLVLLAGVSNTSIAQEHLVYRPLNKWLRLAEEQFKGGHYKLTLQSLEQFRLQPAGINTQSYLTDEVDHARFLQTISLLKLDRPGASDSADLFLSSVSNPVYRARAAYALGQYYFRHDDLGKAIPYYETAGISNLSNEEIANSKFELAYAYFNNRDFAKAEPLLATIKEVQGKYYAAGNYYYGLLAYNNSNYEQALVSFRRIEGHPEYRHIVPYYIAEIYYFMGDRERALEEATRLIRLKDKLYYDKELYLLAAQVLFESQRYGEALPFFEHYYQHTDQIRKEELYEMAYSYYRVNEWNNAIEKFKPLSNSQDSLGQTAMYLLGDCYLKTGDKKSARNAFGICADMHFNPGQQQASLLLFGKLSYEMGFNDAAVRSFNSLIHDFPASAHTNEAKTLLADLHVKTNQFEAAYEALRNVPEGTPEYWRVQQKANFGYAMLQMKKGNLHAADQHLSRSLQRSQNRTYELAALFWRGDIAYRQGRSEDALHHLQQFVAHATRGKNYLSSQAVVEQAYLTMGYAAMDLQNYTAARSYFANAKQNASEESNVAINATVREADAAFMQKDYRTAATLYDRIIAADAPEADYARVQKAVMAGVQGKTNDKIALLQQVINKRPPSAYAHEARYELALAYIEEERFSQAVTVLQALTGEASGAFAPKAWMKLGFAYQEMRNNAKAIEAYKHVVLNYPGFEDRTGALQALRSLYTETNQPEAYAAFLREHSLPAPGAESLDSTYYAAAEAQIAAARWKEAKQALVQYLDRYPNGAFAAKAQYYKGESHYQLKEYANALSAFDVVLAGPWSEFSEASAKRAAEVSVLISDHNAAAKYFGILRNTAMGAENLQAAYAGLMNAAFSAGDFEKAGRYADTLLFIPELNERVKNEAQLVKARALQRQKKDTEALAVYEVLKNAAEGTVAAEARYHIAEIYLAQGKLAEAEKAAAGSIELSTGDEYWVVRCYLLIADILVRQKDLFNAKATLQSVVKNTKDANLRKEASQKLEEVKRLEKQQTKLKD